MSALKREANTVSREDALHKIPLRITDTTLRDAHQSLWATRMRTCDMLPVIDIIDKVGYYSLEMWGGATFDVCLRFLRENPWERLRLIKAKAKNTPLQMLLRGQNLVGYRHYADDVVDRFIALACANGIDIFRVFDALNDTRNLEAAVKAIKRHGGHVQGTLAYTISPVHTVNKFVEYAKEQVALGIDSLCIKDMAGILSPIAAEKLVSALVEEVGIPVQLHCHYTSGMATATYVSGVRAGAGAVDCSISSMAGFSGQPPVETLSAIFSETHYSAHLDYEALLKIERYFAELAPKRKPKSASDSIIDPGILVHQIPGGMISNFRSQLEMQGALDKLPLALEEVIKVRKELGYPPLVTPTSQIVGTQAVMNVLAGERYKIVPNEVKDYVRGMYGRAPAPIDPAFVKKILGEEKPITYRPADKIAPMLPKATDGLDSDLVEKEEDIISYVIYPEPALDYFKWRKLPADQRPDTPAELEVKKMLAAAAEPKRTASPPVQPAGTPDQLLHSEDYKGMGFIVSQAAGLQLEELTLRKGDFALTLHAHGGSVEPVKAAAVAEPAAGQGAEKKEAPAAVQKTVQQKPTEQVKQPEPVKSASSPEPDKYKHVIKAPLVGTFYSTGGPGKPVLVKVGDTVKKGDKVCIVEAMKLFNQIEAPEDCVIKAFLVKDGEHVKKDQVLIAYDTV